MILYIIVIHAILNANSVLETNPISVLAAFKIN